MPNKPRAEAPGRRLSVRFSPEEEGRLHSAALRNRQTLSAFLRDAAAEAASDCLEAPERGARPQKKVF